MQENNALINIIMQKIILSLILYVFSIGCFSQVKVKGYVKKDGTYVSPHVRSNPDGYKYNNYSSYGNVNPYTGKAGTKGGPGSSYNYGTYNYKSNSTSPSYGSSRHQSNSNSYETDNSIVNDGYLLNMVFFSKEGPEFYEVFSIKNNTSNDVYRIKVRLMYYVNSECVDYRDLQLDGVIPSGLTKKFEVRSFDQKQKFVYHKSNSFTADFYTPFSVRMKVLQYFKCY